MPITYKNINQLSLEGVANTLRTGAQQTQQGIKSIADFANTLGNNKQQAQQDIVDSRIAALNLDNVDAFKQKTLADNFTQDTYLDPNAIFKAIDSRKTALQTDLKNQDAFGQAKRKIDNRGVREAGAKADANISSKADAVAQIAYYKNGAGSNIIGAADIIKDLQAQVTKFDTIDFNRQLQNGYDHVRQTGDRSVIDAAFKFGNDNGLDTSKLYGTFNENAQSLVDKGHLNVFNNARKAAFDGVQTSLTKGSLNALISAADAKDVKGKVDYSVDANGQVQVDIAGLANLPEKDRAKVQKIYKDRLTNSDVFKQAVDSASFRKDKTQVINSLLNSKEYQALSTADRQLVNGTIGESTPFDVKSNPAEFKDYSNQVLSLTSKVNQDIASKQKKYDTLYAQQQAFKGKVVLRNDGDFTVSPATANTNASNLLKESITWTQQLEGAETYVSLRDAGSWNSNEIAGSEVSRYLATLLQNQEVSFDGADGSPVTVSLKGVSQEAFMAALQMSLVNDNSFFNDGFDKDLLNANLAKMASDGALAQSVLQQATDRAKESAATAAFNKVDNITKGSEVIANAIKGNREFNKAAEKSYRASIYNNSGALNAAIKNKQ